jgi:hypothetical protein
MNAKSNNRLPNQCGLDQTCLVYLITLHYLFTTNIKILWCTSLNVQASVYMSQCTRIGVQAPQCTNPPVYKPLGVQVPQCTSPSVQA